MSISAIGGTGYTYHSSFEEREVEEPSPEVASLMFDGDIGAQIAALAIRSGQSQRELNGRIQVAEEAAIDREEAAYVAKLHEKADHVRTAGYIGGALTMASGGCTLASSFAGPGKSAGSALSAESDAQRRWSAGAKGADGLGAFLSAPSKGAQEDASAEAAKHEFAAARHKRALEAAQDAYRDGGDLLEKAIEFYKENQQSAADAASASARRL